MFRQSHLDQGHLDVNQGDLDVTLTKRDIEMSDQIAACCCILLVVFMRNVSVNL